MYNTLFKQCIAASLLINWFKHFYKKTYLIKNVLHFNEKFKTDTF